MVFDLPAGMALDMQGEELEISSTPGSLAISGSIHKPIGRCIDGISLICLRVFPYCNRL